MTIGEKIVNLRNFTGMSQEQLAETLKVSRQSVSKWELNQSYPHIDKIIMMCDLFDVSADDFIRDDRVIHKPRPDEDIAKITGNGKHKYFGTDGFRGEANTDLSAEQAFKIGRFLGWYYGNILSGCRDRHYRPRIVIGKDTRRSSYMLEYSIAAGITASGADAYLLHVTTTPSVSFVTRSEQFDCGVMISASHNVFSDNGIKLVNRCGDKMDDTVLSYIEAYLDGNMEPLGINEDLPYATKERIGAVIDYYSGRNRYMGYLISTASHSYREMRIGLDCANGAAWMIAPSIFEALGARLYVINAEPDGMNINREAGSTHIDALRSYVRENNLDAGFAFDGDADRCIAVDEKGNVVNGDHILYILAKRLKDHSSLEKNTIVTTNMSNTGLYKALKEEGIDSVTTVSGDKYVREMMDKYGYQLGGEQSGHIIIRKYATMGDGILTAIMIMEEILDKKTPLSKLAAPVKMLPQVLKNVRVHNKPEVTADPDVKAKVEDIARKIGDEGRIFLRESGTEPVIRIMVECSDKKQCEKYADSVAELIKEKGYAY